MRRIAVLSFASLVSYAVVAHAAAGTAYEPPTHVGPRTEAVPAEPYASVWRVSQTNGSDESGDGSERKPWKTISRAMAEASTADAANRVALFVCAGTYHETVQMRSNVDLYGGFDPSTWQRDIVAHATVLDGDDARRVVVGASDARIDGFVIRRGRIQGPGAGILCDRTSPLITNNAVVSNATLEPQGYIHELMHQLGNDGGGIACTNGAAPLIANNIIAGNSTGVGGGGGIATSNYATPTILNNVLCDNVTGLTDKNESRSSNGAAIACSNLPMKVDAGIPTRKRIANNVILNNRVGGRSDAGGIYCEYDASPEIAGNYILGNAAEDDGGAIYVMKSSEPAIRGNFIAGSKGGGSIRLSKEGRAWIENNLLFANDAGGVNCVGSWMTMRNNTVVANRGNGVAYENNSPHLLPSSSSNNLFFDNTGESIVARGRVMPAMTVVHSLVQDEYEGEGNLDADPQFRDDGARSVVMSTTFDPATYRTRLVLGDRLEITPGRIVRLGDRWGVVHSVDASAIIVWGRLQSKSEASAGVTSASPETPMIAELELMPTYRLNAGSPCIDAGQDAGAPKTDLYGNRRTGRVDIGAVEYQPAEAE